MLRTLKLKRTESNQWRLVGITAFVILIAISAQVEIWVGSPVPFTLQVLTVLLAGMVLGARDGAISTIIYLGLIAANIPVAAGGAGSAALQGASAGYLIGFVPAAFVSGWLVEHGADKVWQRWIAGVIGVLIIYAYGTPTLKIYFDLTGDGATWQQAWAWGVAPFIGFDLLKALIAATLVEGSRSLLMRNSDSKS